MSSNSIPRPDSNFNQPQLKLSADERIENPNEYFAGLSLLINEQSFSHDLKFVLLSLLATCFEQSQTIAAQDARIHALELRAGLVVPEALPSVEDYPTIHMPIETIRVEVTCEIIKAPAPDSRTPIYGPCNQCFRPTDLIAVGDGYFCADCLNKSNLDGTRREGGK